MTGGNVADLRTGRANQVAILCGGAQQERHGQETGPRQHANFSVHFGSSTRLLLVHSWALLPGGLPNVQAIPSRVLVGYKFLERHLNAPGAAIHVYAKL